MSSRIEALDDNISRINGLFDDLIKARGQKEIIFYIGVHEESASPAIGIQVDDEGEIWPFTLSEAKKLSSVMVSTLNEMKIDGEAESAIRKVTEALEKNIAYTEEHQDELVSQVVTKQ